MGKIFIPQENNTNYFFPLDYEHNPQLDLSWTQHKVRFLKKTIRIIFLFPDT